MSTGPEVDDVRIVEVMWFLGVVGNVCEVFVA